MLKGYANYTVMLIPPKNCLKKMVHFGVYSDQIVS